MRRITSSPITSELRCSIGRSRRAQGARAPSQPDPASFTHIQYFHIHCANSSIDMVCAPRQSYSGSATVFCQVWSQLHQLWKDTERRDDYHFLCYHVAMSFLSHLASSPSPHVKKRKTKDKKKHKRKEIGT